MPTSTIVRDQRIPFDVSKLERQAFTQAAAAAGMPRSIWIRDRLRRAAEDELQRRGITPAFLLPEKPPPQEPFPPDFKPV